MVLKMYVENMIRKVDGIKPYNWCNLKIKLRPPGS
jgi:hypothetical protein